jgi:hypothetical protein
MRGPKERAMELLQQSLAEGRAFDHTMHQLYELERLRGYKPFEEWPKPKG